ncbi:MAG: polymer-forming cytoskeletal protein, partial [Candidatus Dadabacteria bacterium]|nr:polymer-forming cytoskeletal protein [Candidatus Dadabacteria bacterium]
GKVMGENSLIVGERGVVTGEIRALEIIVFGRIEGVIETDRLEIKDTGVVTGDLYVGKLVVQEGGIYNGRCVMGGAAERVVVEASGQDDLRFPVSTDPKAIKTK